MIPSFPEVVIGGRVAWAVRWTSPPEYSGRGLIGPVGTRQARPMYRKRGVRISCFPAPRNGLGRADVPKRGGETSGRRRDRIGRLR